MSVTANSTVGAYTVVASVGGVATTADFPLTNSVGAAASITADSGSPQDAVISTAFQIHLLSPSETAATIRFQMRQSPSRRPQPMQVWTLTFKQKPPTLPVRSV
ncbi:hypothetical protein [Pseudovibrio sp. Tun.PSC04-5.I4]|uniref:hypothetical protein n=1 Tax=Pseudovibrio sp. Tun.PSC04-5.I4 TaxID=1798213 RepID=UPI000B8A23EF|nr:hypothetical protein [Pseudovibrio sp. Tun.PSC04-5.I4]